MNPSNRVLAFVETFRVVIGARATLVPDEGRTAHGVLFSLTRGEVDALYPKLPWCLPPEAVSAQLTDGSVVPALCFNLPRRLRGKSEIRCTRQSSENSPTNRLARELRSLHR